MHDFGMTALFFTCFIDHIECIQLLRDISGLEDAPDDQDMSMAETYVSMFLEDHFTLTQITELSEEFDSPSTPRTLSCMDICDASSTLIYDCSTPSITNGMNSCSPTTTTSSSSSTGVSIPASTCITSHGTPTNPVGPPIPREALPSSGDDRDSKDECNGEVKGSELEHRDSNEGKETTAPAESSVCKVKVSQSILAMNNDELRDKLLSLGEKPGPICESTRPAYLSYLAKICAGSQPSGNSGYKGTNTQST